MQTLQLYIEGQRIEMFEDESVNITQTIKNVKDIAKVFTEFTKQFSVPASKDNNKIFKHFYNYDIENGFDARIRKSASIEINNLPFKNGKIRLDGVDMRSNKPHAYRLTFFGSVVELKDVLGEDKLPSLTSTTYSPNYSLDIDFNYDTTTILNNLKSLNATDDNSVVQQGISLPLVTHSQRLYYDSANDSEYSGNLYWGTLIQGLKHTQLKYAVRLDKIIDAIESKYSEITFASDSFFKSGTTDISKIYMWCHRQNAEVTIEPSNEQRIPFTQTNDPSPVSFNFDVVGDLVIEVAPSTDETIQFLATATNNAKYDLIIKKNGVVDRFYEGVSGTIAPTYSTGNFQVGDKFAAFIRTYDENITFSDIKWRNFVGNSVQQTSANSSQLTYFSGYRFNIAENMPEMKIIDFLSSLFKMFNLTAYVLDNGEIQVKPLDDFYGTTRHDISKYINVDKSTIDSALPFKEIFFKYKDTKTILAQQHFQEISDVEWGGEEYTEAGNLDGETYKVEPAFSHAKYEKILDDATNQTTGIQWGYYVTENEEAYIGSPLLLYINNLSASVDISFVANTAKVRILSSDSINMPSNSEDIDLDTSNSLHFSVEKSEYTNTDLDESLFKRFYQNYIQSVFNSKNRITKVSAVLPVGKIISISLSDIIVINDRLYRINSMTTSLRDGKTDFELINYYD